MLVDNATFFTRWSTDLFHNDELIRREEISVYKFKGDFRNANPKWKMIRVEGRTIEIDEVSWVGTEPA